MTEKFNAYGLDCVQIPNTKYERSQQRYTNKSPVHFPPGCKCLYEHGRVLAGERKMTAHHSLAFKTSTQLTWQSGQSCGYWEVVFIIRALDRITGASEPAHIWTIIFLSEMSGRLVEIIAVICQPHPAATIRIILHTGDGRRAYLQPSCRWTQISTARLLSLHYFHISHVWIMAFPAARLKMATAVQPSVRYC